MWVGKVDATAFATHFFFLALHVKTPFFLSLMLFILSKPPTVSFETLDRCHDRGEAFRALDGLSLRRRAYAQGPPENESYLIHGQR
jgi:hypothetical protein